MSCGCAKRMRDQVLPRTGYTYDPLASLWTHESTGETIRDSEIEDHHTRLAAKVIGKTVTNWFTKLESNHGS